MAIVPLFDATHWIAANLKGGVDVWPDTMGAFSSFARMWLLFEGVLCQGGAHGKEFVRIASAIAPSGVSGPTLAAVNDYQLYWTERFPDVAGLCTQFLGDAQMPGSQEGKSIAYAALVLMFSAKRIKETMLYNAKTVDSINEQLEHMDIASQSIAAVILMTVPSLLLLPVSQGEEQCSRVVTKDDGSDID